MMWTRRLLVTVLAVGLGVLTPHPAVAIDVGDVALNQAPDFPHGCEVAPFVVNFDGDIGLSGNPTGSCTWFQSGQAFTAGSRLTGYVPANGRITSVRVRTGPNPAPLRFTVIRQITPIRFDGTLDTGNSACCVGVHLTPPVTLRPNAVTEVPLNLPVRNGRDNVNRIAVSDIFGVSAVAGTGRLPMRITGPANTQATATPGTPIAGFFAPQVAPNEVRTNMTSAPNLRLTLNFSFCASGQPGTARIAASRSARTTSTCGLQPTARRLPVTANRSRVRVPVVCNSGTRCRGTIRITARGKKRPVLAQRKGFTVKPNRSVRVPVKLTQRGRQAVNRGKQVKATIRVNSNAGAATRAPVVLRRR